MEPLSLVSEPIDAYCKGHSSLPSRACEELAEFTRKNIPMSVMLSGPLVGSFLGILIKSIKAKRVLEVGCYTGYSALCMAETLPEDGELITLDINPEISPITKRFWERSPHGKKIKLILGPAIESMNQLKPSFDLIFIDADKANYTNYAKRSLELLSDCGLIVADNCLFQGEVLQPPNTMSDNAKGICQFNDFVHNHPDLESTLLPVRDGLHLVRRRP